MLEQLIERLAQSSLDSPRPIARMGLSKVQQLRLQKSLDFDAKKLRAAAVLIPIQLSPAGNRIILTQRSDQLRHHPGQISFPGGSHEPQDRDLAETALRESQEEIALAPELVRVIGYLPDYPTITGFRVTPIVGIVAEEATVEPDEQEVAAIHYLPLQSLIEGQGLREKSIEHEGFKYPVTEIMYEDIRIWGATAGMLNILRQTLLQEVPP